MADSKITQLPSIVEADIANDDVMQIVDISQPDATKNKKIRMDELDKRYLTTDENPQVLNSVQAGANVTIDNTDPKNPVINATGGGGGAVDSVNGQTGDVVLDADDIDDTSTTNKFVTTAEKNAIATIGSKVASVNAGANVTVDNTDPQNPIISSTGAGDVESVNGQTGIVVLDADDIGETASREFINQDQKEIINKASSTGVLGAGQGVLSIASGTTFSVSDGGALVDGQVVSWTGKTNITVTNIGSSTSTHVLIDSSGDVIQQVSPPTQSQRRSMCYLGKLIHNDLATLTIVNNQQEVISYPANQLIDILRAFKIINFKGNKIRKGVGALQLQKTGGQFISAGANFNVDGNNNPHIRTFPLQSTMTFRYRTRLGEATGDVTSVDPTTWDNEGSSETVSGNDATIQRFYMFPAGAIRAQYGQVVYSNIANAIQAINNIGFVLEDEISENAILIGLLVVRADATDLSDENYAKFYDASIFGEQSVGAGGASVSSIQDVYNNSPVKPQMQLSEGLGGLEISDAATPITGNLFDIVNNAVSETFFSVDTGGINVKSMGFTQNATAKLTTTALENIEFTDSEDTHLLKKESGELYFTDFKNELPTDLFTEDGGATVVNNTTSPMVGVREMQLTQSGASIGDGAEMIIALPTARADWTKGAIDFNILTKHNANDGDFSIVFEESDDNITYTSISTVAVSSAVKETSLKATLKASTQYVKIRAQIAVANDANVLTIARVNVTDNALATTGALAFSELRHSANGSTTSGTTTLIFDSANFTNDSDFPATYASGVWTASKDFELKYSLDFTNTEANHFLGFVHQGSTIRSSNSNTGASGTTDVSLSGSKVIKAGETFNFTTSAVPSSGDPVQLTLDTSYETTISVALGGGGSWLPDTKILASSTGTVGIKSSLSKSDLTIGKQYLVLTSLQFEETSSTSGDHRYNAQFVHDGVTIDSSYCRAVTTSNFRGGYPNAFVFTATATSIDFEVTDLSLTTLFGDGSRDGSYVQYVELPDAERGALVNPSDLQYFYENQTHIGYWKGKKLYAKSFEVTTDTASGSVGSLPAGAMPVGYPQHNSSGTSFRIMQAIDPSSTTGVFINYIISTGDLDVAGSGYHIGAGTSFTVKYTLD